MKPSRRVAVVGHVEVVQFAVVPAVPAAGQIVHASETFTLAAGGGAVAAVQLARLAGAATLFTALGADPAGDAALAELTAAGVVVHAARRGGTRRAFTHLSGDHERAITVLGDRLVPVGRDPLPWDDLAGCDAIYFTGGDAAALRSARRARRLVATARAADALQAADVELDVLVASATDPSEQAARGLLDPEPRHIVLTRGAAGGEWMGPDGATGGWVAEPLPGDPVDAYGCGDAFAAGLTMGLAESDDLAEALHLGARCGAHALCGRGPYAAQLTRRSAA